MEPSWSSSVMGTRQGCREEHTASPGTALWGCDLSHPPQPSHMDNAGHAGCSGSGGAQLPRGWVSAPSSRGSCGGSAPPGRHLSAPAPLSRGTEDPHEALNSLGPAGTPQLRAPMRGSGPSVQSLYEQLSILVPPGPPQPKAFVRGWAPQGQPGLLNPGPPGGAEHPRTPQQRDPRRSSARQGRLGPQGQRPL